MQLRNGKHIDKRIPESWGKHGFVFWLAQSFDPCTYFVKGDNFQDAYDWFISNDRVSEILKVDDPTDYDCKDWEEFERKFTNEGIASITMNDSGVIVDTDLIMGDTLERFLR